jgi:hypothetical protein
MLDHFHWIAKAKTKTIEADTLVARIIRRFFDTFRDCSGEMDVVPLHVSEALAECPIREFANFSETEREDILAAAAAKIEQQSGAHPWTRRVPRKTNPETHLTPVRLLVARNHSFGSGHTHLFLEQVGITLCGLAPGQCPGSLHVGTVTDVNCRSCRSKIEWARARGFDTS